jgi:xylan 1,4-beta-xylosidase
MQKKSKLANLTAVVKKIATHLAPALVLLVLACPAAIPQQAPETINIHVQADQSDGPMPPIWNYWGYDEPNYTYAPNGKKLLAEFAALSPVPVYIRVHNLFTTGDGSASLKWGSTNAYTEDAAGNPIYNWTILDRIFDTFHQGGVKPLVEIGFMPEALSTHPQPYRHTFPDGTIFTGWAYPPKDYKKWSELVFQFVQHLRARYGDAEVKTWMWEVWNEPDIDYWKGTPEEFFQLYDFSADAVLRALPGARIGGPDTTGPGSPKSIAFLRSFLDHCAHQQNYATHKVGSPLDFISFHPKGSPKWLGDHVQMGIAQQLKAVDQGFRIVASFPEWARAPIVLGESDPEGCAACSAKDHPQNSYRNGSLYASYTAESLYNIDALAKTEHINFLGAVNWSFEFEDQPYFAGFREMASNGLDKPVLNTFRMLGLLSAQRVKATSSGALPTTSVVLDGVRGKPDVNAIATRKDHEVAVFVWNYHDDDLPSAAAPIDLVIDGLPPNLTTALTEHLRMDASHSNAFEAWKQLGSPEQPSDAQYQQLQNAGQLQLLNSPSWTPAERGTVHLQFALPRQGLSLVRLAW